MRKLEFGELVGSLGKVLLSQQMWPTLESSSWCTKAKIKKKSWAQLAFYLSVKLQGFWEKKREWLKVVWSEETADLEQWYLMTSWWVFKTTLHWPGTSDSAYEICKLFKDPRCSHTWSLQEKLILALHSDSVVDVLTDRMCQHKKETHLIGKPAHDYFLM